MLQSVKRMSMLSARTAGELDGAAEQPALSQPAVRVQGHVAAEHALLQLPLDPHQRHARHVKPVAPDREERQRPARERGRERADRAHRRRVRVPERDHAAREDEPALGQDQVRNACPRIGHGDPVAPVELAPALLSRGDAGRRRRRAVVDEGKYPVLQRQRKDAEVREIGFEAVHFLGVARDLYGEKVGLDLEELAGLHGRGPRPRVVHEDFL